MPATSPTLPRVLAALVLRESATRFGRSSVGYLWALAEPLGFIAILSLAFSQIAHHPPVGASFPVFYATGFLAFHMYNEMAQIVGRSVHVNRPLLAFPGVTALDTVLARAALQAVTGVAVAAVILAALLSVFAEQLALDPVALGLCAGLAALLGLGVGLVNVTLFALSKSWEVVWGIVSRPVFLVSCVFFTFASLPVAVQEVLWWNPVVHLVGLMRAGIFQIYDPTHVSVSYVLGLALGLNALGLILMRRFRHRLTEQ